MLWQYLHRIFKILVRIEYVPMHFRIGLLVPIPKGTKDKCKQDNYRGLTLISVLGKIFEKCINMPLYL